MSRQPCVIVGIGNSMRRDDGVGPALIEAFESNPPPRCDLVHLDGEPTRVVDAWRGRDLAVVVDAVVTGAPAGTVHVLEAEHVTALASANAGASSHSAGLSEAFALGQALDRMPGAILVAGIEPAHLDHGLGLSPAVQCSFDKLRQSVDALVRSFVEPWPR